MTTQYRGKYISATTGRTVEVFFRTQGNPMVYLQQNYPVSIIISAFAWGS